MKSGSKKLVVIAGVGTGLLLFRAGLPTMLTWLANTALRKVPGIRGKVRHVRIDFTEPRVVVSGLQLAATSNGNKSQYVIAVRSISIGSNWRSLVKGALSGYILLDSPYAWLKLDMNKKPAEGHIVPARVGSGGADEQMAWQERVKQLPAFQISSVAVTNGEIHVTGLTGQDGKDVGISHVELSATNITNSTKLAPSLMATITVHGLISPSGQLAFRAEGYPVAQQPTFDADLQVTEVSLPELSSFLEHNLQIGIRRGVADLYVEAAAIDNYVEGYAKPVSTISN